MTRARNVGAAIWLLGALGNAILLVGLWLTGRVHDETAREMADQMNKLYCPYVGAVIGYYFAQRKLTTNATRLGGAIWIALGVSAAWNGAVALSLVGPWFGWFGIEGSTDFLRSYMPSLGWLVGPTMGFYFGAKSTSEGA